jgi:hypothetical protein
MLNYGEQIKAVKKTGKWNFEIRKVALQKKKSAANRFRALRVKEKSFTRMPKEPYLGIRHLVREQ